MLHRPDDPEVLIEKAMNQAISKHPDNLEDATKYMIELVLADQELFNAVMEPLVNQACSVKISHRFRAENSRMWHAPNYCEKQEGERLRQSTRSRIVRLMDYRLSDGTRMADATKPLLLEDADRQEKQGRRMLQTGQWFRLIASKLRNDKQAVAKALKENDLHTLKSEALKAA